MSSYKPLFLHVLSFTVGKVSSFEEEDGTGTGRNEVRISLSRGDLGSQFTCQAENEAIDQPLVTSVQVDVNRKSKPNSGVCIKYSKKEKGVRTIFLSKVTLYSKLRSMTLQNPDFYPWFYALLAPKSFYYFRASSSISALLLAQKNDIMIFQTNWILIFIQPSKNEEQFAPAKNQYKCQLWHIVGSKLGYEYGKRGDLSIFKTSWFEFAMRRTTRPKKRGLIPLLSFAYSETVSHWSLGCRDSHIRGLGGQSDVSDLGCPSRSRYHVVQRLSPVFRTTRRSSHITSTFAL